MLLLPPKDGLFVWLLLKPQYFRFTFLSPGGLHSPTDLHCTRAVLAHWNSQLKCQRMVHWSGSLRTCKEKTPKIFMLTVGKDRNTDATNRIPLSATILSIDPPQIYILDTSWQDPRFSSLILSQQVFSPDCCKYLWSSLSRSWETPLSSFSTPDAFALSSEKLGITSARSSCVIVNCFCSSSTRGDAKDIIHKRRQRYQFTRDYLTAGVTTATGELLMENYCLFSFQTHYDKTVKAKLFLAMETNSSNSLLNC